MPRPTRRQFCAQAGLLVSGGCLAATGLACRRKQTSGPASGSSSSAPVPELRTFTPAAFATISAVCERLLPRDDDPGAIDLGVPAFIDRMLASPDLTPVREQLLQGVPALDKQSRARFAGRAFAEATPDEQDGLLRTWQHGRGGAPRFVELMLRLTLEGAFGDPKYGGNTGGRGFDMIGFTPGPPMPKMPGMSGAQGTGP
jgi:gluconate 2-dehydrogenase gamma chain